MKLGMPLLYEFDNIEDNLILAKSLDLDFVELNLNFSYCRKEMEENNVLELLKKYNLEATLHFYDEGDLASYKEISDAYLVLLDKYLKLGKGYIKNLNVHLVSGPVVTISGIKNYIYEKEYDEYISRFKNALKKAKLICEENNVRLVLENVDNRPLYMERVYKDLHKENFSFCYDIGHDHLSKDILWNINKELNLNFKEFHIHDAKDNKICHLALLEGSLDIKKYKELATINDAYVVLEVKSKEDLIKSISIFNNL